MTTKLSFKAKPVASSLLTVLIICSILSVSTMSYLSLMEQQNTLSFRSQSWNVAIAVTEAGLEEGLQQLNNNTWNLAADGWTQSGSVYSFSRTFPDANSYTVRIDMSGDPFHPTIIARSSISLSSLKASVPLAAIGVPNTTPSTVARAVRVRCARGNMLIKGMVAKHRIDMNGNNILTDSFDSTDPAWSTSGQYDSTKTKANGDIATNDALANSLTTGNANIYGHAATGPGGSIAVGTQGGVGTQAWVAGHHGQVQAGYFSDNANFTFPDQSLPYNTGLPPVSGMLSVTNYVLGTNGTTSASYPNPVPIGGVITNANQITTNVWKNTTLIVTNCGSAMNQTKSKPAAGSCCLNPPPWQTGKDANWWYWYSIASYSYPVYTYTYNLYSTNYTVTTSGYDHILKGPPYQADGNYYLNTPLSGKTLVMGACNLVLPAGIKMAGTDSLNISQDGSINIYVGANSSVGGNGVINQHGFAIDCQVFCTPNVTSFSLNGNGSFIGVIVAPQAFVQMNGSGKAHEDFIGALVADSVKMNGHFEFHYDEALGKTGANSRFIVTSWDEINPVGY